MNAPSAKDLNLARQVKQRLNEKIKITDFRIYGSRARGDANWDSDLDLYIEVPAITKEERKFINSVAWEVGLENDLVITPVIVTKEQLVNTPFTVTTFYQTIEQEGIRLWDNETALEILEDAETFVAAIRKYLSEIKYI